VILVIPLRSYVSTLKTGKPKKDARVKIKKPEFIRPPMDFQTIYSRKYLFELGDILPFRTNKKRSNRQQSV
jgi:hypothetical protein